MISIKDALERIIQIYERNIGQQNEKLADIPLVARRALAILSALPVAPVVDEAAPIAVVYYTNWRGETSRRRIIPKSVRYGSTEWHPEPQWLMLAWDDDKQADREFALKDFGARAVVDEAGIRAGEREKCAAIADDYQRRVIGHDGQVTAGLVAQAIRAGGGER
jgi:hypothetical protein